MPSDDKKKSDHKDDKHINVTPATQSKDKKIYENIFRLEDVYPDTSKLLAQHYVPNASDESVIVCLDTNALLLFYSLEQHNLTAVNNVYKTLRKQNRLLIPARVIREFISNRDGKLAEMVGGLYQKKSQMKVPESKLSPLLDGVPGYSEFAKAGEILHESYKIYMKQYDSIVEKIKSWSGNDPVSKLYNDLFDLENIIDHAINRDELIEQWKTRCANDIPPGNKDVNKPDTGIGDFIIWKTILQIGKDRKQDLIFVTNDQKNDWIISANKIGLYARPELIDEYRRASGGANIRLSTLANLLKEMSAPEAFVDEVRVAEEQANTVTVSGNQIVGGDVTLRSLRGDRKTSIIIESNKAEVISSHFSKAIICPDTNDEPIITWKNRFRLLIKHELGVQAIAHCFPTPVNAFMAKSNGFYVTSFNNITDNGDWIEVIFETYGSGQIIVEVSPVE